MTEGTEETSGGDECVQCPGGAEGVTGVQIRQSPWTGTFYKQKNRDVFVDNIYMDTVKKLNTSYKCGILECRLCLNKLLKGRV